MLWFSWQGSVFKGFFSQSLSQQIIPEHVLNFSNCFDFSEGWYSLGTKLNEVFKTGKPAIHPDFSERFGRGLSFKVGNLMLFIILRDIGVTAEGVMLAHLLLPSRTSVSPILLTSTLIGTAYRIWRILLCSHFWWVCIRIVTFLTSISKLHDVT